MKHFVVLLRKAKRPQLVVLLIERASNTVQRDLVVLASAAEANLSAQSRKVVFYAVAKLDADIQWRIERAAERVVLLDDDYGAQAVYSLLDMQDIGDAAIRATPSDRYSRALHLCLLQDFAEKPTAREHRFDRAERLQVMHRQWKSENYSSHYLGPKDVVPKIDSKAEDGLRARIGALFPQAVPGDFLIELFTRQDLAHADRYGGKDVDEVAPVLLYTLSVTFNGSTAQYQQVANHELIDHEEPAAISACFSWEPQMGALGVFCEDREVRRDLAIIFRDVVLTCDGAIHDMPIREFNLAGFSSPAMLKRLEQDRLSCIEKIWVLQIKIAHPIEQHSTDEANGREIMQLLSSTMLIAKDRRDARDIYQVSYDDYGVDDLAEYTLAQVKLVIRMAKQLHRKAHNVAVQLTSPNGLNDNSKTEDDRKRVLEQLARIGVLREF